MTAPSEQALERLAELCGIVAGYEDVEGTRHATSPATRSALLHAMGVETDTAEAVAAAIEVREDGPWRRVLAPAVVLRSGGTVALRVPERLAGRDWSYRLQREDGGVAEGVLRPAHLAVESARQVSAERHLCCCWTVPELPTGYHRLHIRCGDTTAEALLVVAPERCYLPPAIADGRVWGPTLQLFALHSHRNWGIGDFTDLRMALQFFARHGAGTVGLGPLHSLYPHEPEHTSPYSPSSRSFWNVLYLDVEAVPGLDACERARLRLDDPEFRARIAAARDLEIIDYSETAALKREILELVFEDFGTRSDTPLAREFRHFQESQGQALYRHALFEALAEHFRAVDPQAWGWPAWPEGYRHPEAPAVRTFAAEHGDRVEFFAWLQWLAERQLGAAAALSAELGFGVGLYLDMPLGVDSGGSEVWAGGDLFTRGATAGAPPDDFNLRGQGWGLVPWIPERLAEREYAPFVELLRRNMRHAGALRLDHVMSLMRLFWIPLGGVPADGAYVRYPLEDLLGILALESQRHRCAVIGEDLGTVPDELRAALAPMGVLSNRVSYFEKGPDGEFPPPADLPRQSLVTVSNHDLATLRGYWRGEDIALRQRLGLYASENQREDQVVARAQDRARLLFALGREGLLPERIDADPLRVPDLTVPLMVAVHRYLARGSSMVLTFQMEDAFGVLSQVNVPGTTSEHPNWRRKLPVALERWAEDSRLVALLDALVEERGVGAAAGDAGKQRALVVPAATYRLQLNGAFTFNDVLQLVPYLARLGISHCYLSPFLKARPGSSHGYDVIDHGAVDPEIGSRQDLDRLATALREAGMGQIADIVPNHMGIMGADNAWWLDVLENGQASPYAEYFDIDWHPARPELRDKVLIPVLGDHYGTALENGELKLVLDADAGALAVYYYEHKLPLDPASYGAVLGLDLEVLGEQLGAEHVELAEYQSVLRALEQLPPHTETDAERRQERLREKEVAKRRLEALCRGSALIRQHVETNVARVSGTAGNPESFAMLHDLLERQAWRVAHWQVAADEINYRRFFDINDLAALRPELPEVLARTHELVAALYRDGVVDGVRIDHPDGLYDPADYLNALQRLLAGGEPAAGTEDGSEAGCYVVVEKILAPHEHLPAGWAAQGTTGYEFAFLTSSLTVFPEAEEALDRCYRTFVGQWEDFDDLVYRCKKLVIRVHLSSELTMLTNLLNRIAQADWHTRDFTVNGIRDALAEIVACFPVYRTYVTARGASAEDRRYLDWAISWARQRDPETNPDLYEFIRRRALLELGESVSPWYRALCERFAMKFQQYTAPVMAKALEDTSFYRYPRLLSLCEVGGDPRRFGTSVAAFHHHNQERARRWPHGMLAGSTHDNKRSEDVRARLNVITELADEWEQRVARWQRLNAGHARSDGDGRAPARRDEYFYYQSLVGIWPLDTPDAQALESLAGRLTAYLHKAAREAKDHTSWVRPDEGYEAALESFVASTLNPAASSAFIADVDGFVGRLAIFGLYNSLSQLTLRFTAPGVPDLYQGDELWSFSLVDPDNRRPVDFARRQAALEALVGDAAQDRARLVATLMEEPRDGRIKLYYTSSLLALRAGHRGLFDAGDYLPLAVTGARAEHVCAFARRWGTTTVVVVAGRWFARLLDADGGAPEGAGERASRPIPALTAAPWADTVLELPQPGVTWRNVITGEMLSPETGHPSVGGLLGALPAAVLVSGAGSEP